MQILVCGLHQLNLAGYFIHMQIENKIEILIKKTVFTKCYGHGIWSCLCLLLSTLKFKNRWLLAILYSKMYMLCVSMRTSTHETVKQHSEKYEKQKEKKMKQRIQQQQHYKTTILTKWLCLITTIFAFSISICSKNTSHMCGAVE